MQSTPSHETYRPIRCPPRASRFTRATWTFRANATILSSRGASGARPAGSARHQVAITSGVGTEIVTDGPSRPRKAKPNPSRGKDSRVRDSAKTLPAPSSALRNKMAMAPDGVPRPYFELPLSLAGTEPKSETCGCRRKSRCATIRARRPDASERPWPMKYGTGAGPPANVAGPHRRKSGDHPLRHAARSWGPCRRRW